MTRFALVIGIVIGLAGCAPDVVPRDWKAEGATIQARWEVVARVAIDFSPCDVGEGELVIRYHDGDFPCYPKYGNGPPYCHGMTSWHVIDVDGTENADVTYSALPYEAANTLAQICWGESEESPRMQALALQIAAEARRRIAAIN